MTSISKCRGLSESEGVCPKRLRCYRYTAPESDTQAWVSAKWPATGTCESFLARGPVPEGLSEDELIRGYTPQSPIPDQMVD